MKPHSGLVLAFFLVLSSFAQAQVLVGDFNIITKNVGQVRATAYSNNVLVHGAIDHLDGDYQGRLLLLNAVGERVNTFASVYADGVIWDVQTQTDGKILISGQFTMINDIPAPGLARLNSDGTVDDTFNAAVSGVEDLTLQSDGKIIVRIGGQLKRLNTNGSLDNEFTSASDAGWYCNVETGSDDAIYYAAGRTVKKLLADGSVDLEFSSGPTDTNGYPYGIKSMPDGTLLVFGTFTSYNEEAKSRMVKVDADGSIVGDFTFDPSVTGFIKMIVLRADNSIVVAGELVTPGGNQRLIQINSAGTLVRGIADGAPPSSYSVIERVTQTDDGKIIAAGDFSLVNGHPRPGLVMFNDDYSISDFKPEVSSMLVYYNSASVAPCGPLYFLTGYIPGVFTDDLPYEVMIADDGTVTEAPPGLTGLNHLGFQNDNKILMFNNSVERRHSDGSADNSFSFPYGGDIPFEVPFTTGFREFHEKLYIAGQFANFYGHNSRSLIALNKDGSIYKTYDALPSGSSVTSIAFQSDGKIVLAGYFPMEGYMDASHVVRLNTDGSLDAAFNLKLLANLDTKNTHDIAVDAYDRIYVTGYNSSSLKYSITRVNADGTVDDSFDGGSFAYDSPSITHNLITLLPDNTVMVGGNFAGYKGTAIRALAHIDENGDLIPLSNVQFGRGTTVTFMEDAAGSLYMTGYFVRNDYKAVSAIARVFFEDVSILPVKPAGLSSSYSAPKVNLTWNDKSNNENFYILQRATVNSDFVSIDTVDENLNFAYDLGATEPGTYQYRIKAVNCFGDSPWSDIVSVTIPDPTLAPTAPSLLEASIENDNAHISWTDNSADEHYFVLERYTNDNNAALFSSDTVDANVNIFIYEDLSANIVYNFRVRAENGAGYSAWSNVASLIFEVAPPAPTDLTVSFHAEGVALAQWQDASNLETYFVLERSKDASTEMIYDTIAANTTSVLSSGIDAHQTYYFRIKSVNEVGSSAWSQPASFLWNPVPVNPGNLVATENGAEVALTWSDNSTDEESFVIERSTSPVGDFAVLQVVDANETTATDTPADYGLNYYYRVKAVNDAGSSGWSNVDSVFWAPAPNGSIQLQVEEIDYRVFKLTWVSTVTHHQRFIVERSLGNDKTFEPVDTVSADTHVYIDTLDTAQAYYYRVVAYNPSGVIVSNQIWMLITSVNEGAPAIEIYPNSFQDVIVVQGRNVNGSFAIISSDGRTHKLHATSTPGGVSLDASLLPSGLYIIKFANSESSWSQKLLKQ